MVSRFSKYNVVLTLLLSGPAMPIAGLVGVEQVSLGRLVELEKNTRLPMILFLFSLAWSLAVPPTVLRRPSGVTGNSLACCPVLTKNCNMWTNDICCQAQLQLAISV